MLSIDKEIKRLKDILNRQKCKAIIFKTIGSITIQFTLHTPKYTFLKEKEYIELYDKITDKRVIIDIHTAIEIEINEQCREYDIRLDNGQYIKMKMF